MSAYGPAFDPNVPPWLVPIGMVVMLPLGITCIVLMVRYLSRPRKRR